MPTLHVLIGVPASGKSTLADRLDGVTVSSDALREAITGSAEDLSRDDEVWEAFHFTIQQLLSENHDVVADATNLTESSRCLYHQLEGVELHAHVMAVPFLSACLRNDLRDRHVPLSVMLEMQHRADTVTVQGLYEEGFHAVSLHDLAGGTIQV